jgi:tRNA-2-methylthio-N6-dimethylallyladenosine synthase
VIPGVSLTTDIISGFPTESEEDHRRTVELMREVRYDGAYTFKYSPRERTPAWDLQDDISEEEKGRRVYEIARIQQEISHTRNEPLLGNVERVLVDGPSRKTDQELTGRTDSNKTVIFPAVAVRPGTYVDVLVERVNSATLFGRAVGIPAHVEAIQAQGAQE